MNAPRKYFVLSFAGLRCAEPVVVPAKAVTHWLEFRSKDKEKSWSPNGLQLFSWLPFIHTVRTEHYSYDPLRMKQIRELVDDFEAGNLELQEKSYANV